ncbi:MAG: hypothetical protein KIT33_08060 [Candidatus Kapabacteria bacterium]|nr:hypothetical protein [Ignavibacteriota bacterium]MCW5884908.1 hypothetical protein [Candidatus Kapabacteria bacterium]
MKFKLISAIVSLLAVMMIFQSCSNDGSVSNTDTDSEMSFIVYDYNLDNFSFDGATPDKDISIFSEENLRPERDVEGRKLPPQVRERVLLSRVFRLMELDEEQIAAIRTLMIAHISCENQWFRKLNAVRSSIVERANAERRNIMQQVREGEITRQQAERLINQLNTRVREALKNHPINIEVREGLILCREEFFAAIAELLNDEQLALWERYLNSLPKR